MEKKKLKNSLKILSTKNDKADINKRNIAIQKATKNAILTPFKVMEIGLLLMDVIKNMAEIGNPNSIKEESTHLKKCPHLEEKLLLD